MDKIAVTDAIILDWIPNEDLLRGYSRVDQQNVLSKFCQKNGISPIATYTSDAESGLRNKLNEILDFLDNQPNDKKFQIIAYKIPNWRQDSTIESRFISRTNVGTLDFFGFYHQCFVEPENPQTRIWRYINLPKFLDMLQSKTLYFARADELRRADKFEGSYETQPTRTAKEMVRRGIIPVPHEGIDLGFVDKWYPEQC
jgi:hypothetical protein